MNYTRTDYIALIEAVRDLDAEQLTAEISLGEIALEDPEFARDVGVIIPDPRPVAPCARAEFARKVAHRVFLEHATCPRRVKARTQPGREAHMLALLHAVPYQTLAWFTSDAAGWRLTLDVINAALEAGEEVAHHIRKADVRAERQSKPETLEGRHDEN